MYLLKKLPASNSRSAQIIYAIVIAILMCFIGYMLGKFLWYVSH